MITLRQRIESRIEKADSLYQTLLLCEETLDSLLPPDAEISAARPLEGFFRTSILPPPPPAPITNIGDITAKVAKNIKRIRKDQNMTQQDLAQKTGIRRPNIARLERSTNLPNLATLAKIAIALETPLESFFNKLS